MDLPHNIVNLTYITKQHVPQHYATSPVINSSITYTQRTTKKKHENMQHMVVMDKLPMTRSYAELNFKLQHISSFFVHHPPTTINNLLGGMLSLYTSIQY